MAEKEADETDGIQNKDQSCYSYEGNICVYTDPDTQVQYLWDKEKNNWKERLPGAPDDVSQDHSSRDYVYNGETYIYTDKNGERFKWNSKNNEWVNISNNEVEKDKIIKSTSTLVDELKSGAYDHNDEKHTYTDPTDGTVYEWDREKNAWFPKLDDDFMAQYQMNYGFTQEQPESTKNKERKDENVEQKLPEDENALKRKGPPPPPAWFDVDDEHNTKVYVSNLPHDVTEKEFLDVMQKCGLVMKDPDNNRMKIKLYCDSEGRPKGDALCSYIKVESVELALKLLDGMDLRGHKIHVERAKFRMKGDTYDAKLKPRKKRKKDKEKMKKMQEKLFDWRPDKLRGERPGHERVVVVKNLFEAGIFDQNAALLLEYREDLREECSKCGHLRKVVIHDRHPEGVAQIFFQDAEEADICVKLLNGRWFGQRRLVAETWDGKTKYRVEETEEEREKRLQNWAKFLESEESGKTMEAKETKKNKDGEEKEQKGQEEQKEQKTTDASMGDQPGGENVKTEGDCASVKVGQVAEDATDSEGDSDE